MLLTFVVGFILFALFLIHAGQKRRRDAVANLGGPFCIPILGAIHLLFNLNPKNILERNYKNAIVYGKVMRVWAFNRLVVTSADVELNEQLLSSQQHIVKHRNYRMMRQWLGVGLLLSDGKKWFARRKIITPTFHYKILEEFVEVFDQQSTVFVERLAKRADGHSTFDVYCFVCLATLDIIAETAMGTKVYAQTDTSTEYAIAVNRMTKLMSWRFMKLHLNSELVFTIMYPHLKLRQMKLIRTMHDFTSKVIEKRRRKLEQSLTAGSTNDQTDDVVVGCKKRMALLDVLLHSTIDGKPLTNEDIREEVDTFMFEGHDTTTSAISFALHLIARHLAVQKKLLAEVLAVLGEDRTRPITLRDLNELKYTECVIKETLRLYPSVPIIGRQIEEDFKYTHSKLGDGVIPAGTEFFVIIHGIMRDSEIFKNHLDFIPERYETNEMAPAFAMIPFSAGPRNCIGQKFAMLEMKTMIAKAVREYELLPFGETVQPELNIVMRSSTDFQLGMRKRSSSKNCILTVLAFFVVYLQ